MEAVNLGYQYKLDNLEKGGYSQHIQFINKNLENPEWTVNGTTSEEVLKMMISRISYLNSLMHSPYNLQVLQKLSECLDLLEKRAEDRKERGVEGTDNP